MTCTKHSAAIHPFALGFAGFSGSGKTTLITRLLNRLRLSFRVGYFKHDAHRFELDHPGKDTWRAREAGAFRILISSDDQQASIATGTVSGPVCPDCDLLLIEGWKQAPWPKIILLDAEGQMLAKWRRGELGPVLACVSETAPDQAMPLPWFQRDDIEGLLELMLAHFRARAAEIPLYGLVLAGGYSRRMGRDKAELDYHGRPQLSVAAELLRGGCERVFVSVRPGQAPELPPGTSLIEDRLLDFGPLGGMLTAMYAHPQAAWLVLACDLPRLDHTTLEQLWRRRDPLRQATAFVSPHDGLPEPLCTIYEPSLRQALFALLASGRSCPRAALRQARLKLMQPAEPDALENANTPEAFERIRQSLRALSTIKE